MKELTIENLHKTYGTKTLLDGVDLSIKTGDRIGLIGPNGTGKSSLLKVISGKDSYDQGEISHPNQYRIAYLDQNPQLDPNKTILETIYDSPAPLVQLVLAYQAANEKIIENPNDTAAMNNFTKLSDRMNQEGGWDMEVKARTILTKLGLFDLNRLVGECSGGEQKRIGIAQVLLNDADLLILDEPTNHLDISSIAWLEDYLSQYQGALLIVTHDRYFLDRVSNRIIELRNGHLRQYTGNYEDYLNQRAVEVAHAERAMAKQDRLYQQELAWMRTGAKARTTKQQARINRFEDLKSSIDSRTADDKTIELAFDQQRIGKQILSLEDVSVSINDLAVIDEWTKEFVKTDRLGIIGENGIGKSTLLDALAGIHPIDSGIYHVGQTVRMAYYRQLDQDLPGDMRVLAYLSQVADQFKREDGSVVSASQLLEQFNFDRNMHGVTISTLSGGEKRRLYLLTLLVQEPNVLFLDEPTNDLDIDTLTVLEDYLQQFEGVVIVVSHDRYFLDKTSNQILELQGDGKFRLAYGNYSDYVGQYGLVTDQPTQTKTEKKPTAEPVNKPQPAKAKRLTYHEQKEWQTIEEDIMTAEAKVEDIQNQMSEYAHDAGKLMELQAELEELEAQVLHLYERYDYLSDIVEGGK